MLAKCVEIDGNVELIENSGVQFVDYEVTIDWGGADLQVKKYANGYFFKYDDKTVLRLQPQDGEELEPDYRTGISRTNDENDRGDKVDPQSGDYNEIKLLESLKLYNEVWFPLPFFNKSRVQALGLGPLNWARCRIVDITDRLKQESQKDAPEKEEEQPSGLDRLRQKNKGSVGGKRTYHIVMAFDTKLQKQDQGVSYFAPTVNDVSSGHCFELCDNNNVLAKFLKPQQNGIAWVNEWVESVYKKLARERLNEVRGLSIAEIDEEYIGNRKNHQAHYLNMLAFLSGLVDIKPVKFIANSIDSKQTVDPVEVSLVLDIGNSRSCGIMVEKDSRPNRQADDFSNTYVLSLRDLNTPEEVYQEPFVSRIEFTEANFDFDGKSARSGYTEAFTWPSFVRVGNEAVKLASHHQGNEGLMGLGSPKRYLWNKQNESNNNWSFNSFSYQIDSEQLRKESKTIHKRAFALPVGSYINSNGDALFALRAGDNNRYCQSSNFSWRSTMTFMLLEIFLQALIQMNSITQRKTSRDIHKPRQLKSIILTVPPAMAAAEKESLRSSVYEALGILWKSLGYDDTPRTEFNFADEKSNIYPPVPEVSMDWNEAEAGQVVFLYNETQKIFRGRCHEFVKNYEQKHLRPRFNDHEINKDSEHLDATRIATIDIGGGTTDLVIRDYTFVENCAEHEGDIIPYEVLSDGSRIAGDDIILEIIKKGPFEALSQVVKDNKVINSLLGNNVDSVQEEALRQQVVQQVFIPIALRIMFHMEHLEDLTVSCTVSGTFDDFLKGTEQNPLLDEKVVRPAPAQEPEVEVIEWFNRKVQDSGLADFDLLKVKFEIDVGKLNNDLAEGVEFNICQVLNRMAEILALYDVDVLLLTGRPSKIPGVREFFLQRLPLSPERVIAMHHYQCESWYPFSSDGVYIGDPKTTAAVGALLSHLRLNHTNFPNFRYRSQPNVSCNQMHYIGILDNEAKIPFDSVIFTYASEQEAAIVSQKAEEFYRDPKNVDNFLNLKPVIDDEYADTLFRETRFKTKLSANIGYRQFVDPNLEAVPLYSIEAIKRVEDAKKIQKARALFMANDPQVILESLDPKVKVDYEAKINAALNAQTIDDNALRLSVESEVFARIDAEVQSAHANDKQGFFDKFRGKKREAEIAQEIANKRAQAAPEISQKLEALVNEKKREAKRQLNVVLKEAVQANVQEQLTNLENKFKRLERYLEDRRSFDLEVELKVIKSAAEHPYPYLKEQLKEKLPSLVEFKLKRVEVDGAEFNDFFNFNLKTVINPLYWSDSGCIA